MKMKTKMAIYAEPRRQHYNSRLDDCLVASQAFRRNFNKAHNAKNECQKFKLKAETETVTMMTTQFVKVKYKRSKCYDFKPLESLRNMFFHLLLLQIIIVAVFTRNALVECAQLEATQIKLLINDDELLAEKTRHHQQQLSADNPQKQITSSTEHDQYNFYRNDLKRLPYETIHRILRDENEPISRREDSASEMHFYRKRSYELPHDIVKRNAGNTAQTATVSLDLRNQNLTDFKYDGVAATVKSIDLSHNNLSQIDLLPFSNLQVANLSWNHLTVPPITVANSTIVTLILNHNRIKSFNASPNSKLLNLFLSSNAIENLASLNLSSLPNLETLDLSCNQIKNFDSAFFPDWMFNLRNLNLANNNLNAISRKNFFNLFNLNTLILSGNKITVIDYETFLSLPNLQFLDLSFNQLHGESIRALQGIPDLSVLSTAYNPKMGDSLQEFVASWSLKEVDASGTGLRQIPAALAQAVRTLKLTDNWFKIISCGDLDSYPLLQHLDLSNSHIQDIEDDALGRLELLEVLFLSHNQLRQVPLSLPTSLEHLFLQYNEIMDIQTQAFQGLQNLKTLDLSHNKLLYLPALSLPKLVTLNLQSSGLQNLNQAIVHTLPHLRDLLLEDNPIKCSELLGIAEWASPCRINERTANSILNASKINTRDDNDDSLIVSPPNENALKRLHLRMHNFHEKFDSCNCECNRGMLTVITDKLGQELSPLSETTQQPPVYATQAEEGHKGMPTTMASAKLEGKMGMHKAKRQEGQQQQQPQRKESFENLVQAKAQKPEAVHQNLKLSNIELFKFDHKTSTDEGTTTSRTISKSKVAAIITPGSSKLKRGNQTKHLGPSVGDLSMASQEKLEDGKHEEKIPKEAHASTGDVAITNVLNANVNNNTMTTQTAQKRIEIADKKESTTPTMMPASSLRSAIGEPSLQVIKETLPNLEMLLPTKAKTTTVVPTTSTNENYDSNDRQQSQTQEKVSPPDSFASNKANYKRSDTNKAQSSTPTAFEDPAASPTTLTLSASAAATHKHMQLHLKDRHLIGTPLLMHNGDEHVLVEAKGHWKFQETHFDSTTEQAATTTTTKPTMIVATSAEMTKEAKVNTSASHLAHGQNEKVIIPAMTLKPTKTLAAPSESSIATTASSPSLENVADKPFAMTPHINENKEAIKAKLNATNVKIKSSDKEIQTEDVLRSILKEKLSQGPMSGAHIPARRVPTTNTTHPSKTQVNTKHSSKKAHSDEVKKKPAGSLIMKKMTITTKHANSKPHPTSADYLPDYETSQSRQHHHHFTLNTPRENEATRPSFEGKVYQQLKPFSLNEEQRGHDDLENNEHEELQKHSTVNSQSERQKQKSVLPTFHDILDYSVQAKPLKSHASLNPAESVAALTSVSIKDAIANSLEHHDSPHEKLTKTHTAQLAGKRQDDNIPMLNAHPGFVILASFGLLILLLVGLMHVYRCDLLPWQNRHQRQQRPCRAPGQQPFGLDANDAGPSFLNYQSSNHHRHCNFSKWQHSPLHHLQVRELQQTSAVDAQQIHQAQRHFFKHLPSQQSNSSGDRSQGSSVSSSSRSSAMFDDETLYIEMTPDSAQTSAVHHGDLLPMELLNLSCGSNSPSSRPADDFLETESSTLHEVVLPTLQQSNQQHQYSPNDDEGGMASQSSVKAGLPATRKFGIW